MGQLVPGMIIDLAAVRLAKVGQALSNTLALLYSYKLMLVLLRITFGEKAQYHAILTRWLCLLRINDPLDVTF